MDNRRVGMKTLKVAFLAVVMSLAARTTSYAGPLNIALDSDPVLNAQTIISTFNSVTGLFQASGTAFFWTGKTATETALAFKLTANFSGGQPTTASLIVGSEAAPFLSGTGLAGFSYTAVRGGTLEFLFDNIGGTSTLFSSAEQLDVQITVSPLFTPQFTTSWGPNVNNTAIVRQTDTEPVPEPSTLLALVAGAGGLLMRRRRRAANL
jgi:hypothetical protein